MKIKLLLTLLTLAATEAHAQEAPTAFVCTTSEKFVCNMGSGCATGVANTWANVDLRAATYERCGGATPCDRYEARVALSGQTFNVEVPGKAAFLKLLPTGAFSEVASQGTITIVSYGYCKPR